MLAHHHWRTADAGAHGGSISGGCFKNSWESLTLPVRRHNAQAILAAPRSESSTAAAPPQSGAHALPSATPAPRTRSSHPPPRSPPHANPLLALLVSLGAASLRVALGVVRIERATWERLQNASQPSVAPVPSPLPQIAGAPGPGAPTHSPYVASRTRHRTNVPTYRTHLDPANPGQGCPASRTPTPRP